MNGNDSNLNRSGQPQSGLAGADDQRLETSRFGKLSCLFDVDSNVRALPLTAQPTVRQTPPSNVRLPEQGNSLPSDAAALESLLGGRSRRKNSSGSKKQRLRWPTPEDLSARSAMLPSGQRQGQPTAPAPDTEYNERPPVRRQRITLVGLCRWLVWYVNTKPTDAVQYPVFVAFGVIVRLLVASNAVGVNFLIGTSVLITVVVVFFRPDWRELLLSICLLTGVLVAGLFC